MSNLRHLTPEERERRANTASAMPVGVARCPGCRRRVALCERLDGTRVLRLHQTLPSAKVDGVPRLQGDPCPWSMRPPAPRRYGRRLPGGNGGGEVA